MKIYSMKLFNKLIKKNLLAPMFCGLLNYKHFSVHYQPDYSTHDIILKTYSCCTLNQAYNSGLLHFVVGSKPDFTMAKRQVGLFSIMSAPPTSKGVSQPLYIHTYIHIHVYIFTYKYIYI